MIKRISHTTILINQSVRTATYQIGKNGVIKIKIEIPNELWLSANRLGKGGHPVHKKAKALKLIGEKTQKIYANTHPPIEWAIALYAIGYTTRGKADPSNAQPTIKHLLDGLTKNGLLTDDDSKHLAMEAYTRSQVLSRRGFHTVEMVFYPSVETASKGVFSWLKRL